MKAGIAILTFLVVMTSALASPSKPTQAPTPLTSNGEGPIFYIDFSNFQGDNENTFVEFYVQVSYDELQFIKQNGRFHAAYKLDFTVLTENDSLIEANQKIDTIDLDTYGETQSIQKARVMLLGYSLKPGAYKIKAQLQDVETQHSSVIEQVLNLKNFCTRELSISDIQLSQKIEPAENGLPYVKNSRYIEPNASRVFAHGLNSDIYLYFEVYNFVYVPGCDNSTYTAFIAFFDDEGKQVAQIQRKKQKPGDTSAHSMKFPIQSFKQGEYYVTIRVQDDVSGQSCESTRGFTVLEQSVDVTEIEVEKWLY